jgi:hypothetical protein
MSSDWKKRALLLILTIHVKLAQALVQVRLL